MKIDSPRFGTLEITPESIVEFPAGLAGFESLRRFSLFHPEGGDGNYFILQSVEDPAVAFHLADPARFGLRGKIESILRAATMLGRQNLRQWLQVVILSDISTADKAQELVRISVMRGRFLQLLAASHPTPFDEGGMFLLGFFSVLDAILDQHMNTILEEISIDAGIKSALVDAGDSNASWIGLLGAIDRCDPEELSGRAESLGIPQALIGELVVQASAWTDEVMGSG